MGITTFQRFNGQELNPPYTWSERGPVEKLHDANPKPNFPDTSIAYLRWYWSALEPEHGNSGGTLSTWHYPRLRSMGRDWRFA